jgi:hypothetical protein
LCLARIQAGRTYDYLAILTIKAEAEVSDFRGVAEIEQKVIKGAPSLGSSVVLNG